MKICPRCQKTYSDDNLNFCLEDGSVLAKAAPSQASYSGAPPTVPQQSIPSQPGAPPNWQSQPQQQQQYAMQPAKKSSKAWVWVLLILGLVVLVCGGGIVGMLYYAGKQGERFAANLTNTSSTANRSNSNSLSTTSTSNSDSARTDVEKLDLEPWVREFSIFGTTEYTGGELVMGSKQKGYYYVLAAPENYTTDDADTRVTLRNMNDASSSLGYGLVFHSNPTPLQQGYAFLIDTKRKKYRVVNHAPQKESTVVSWTNSSAIKPGTEENTLEVRDLADSIDLYINGTKVNSIKNVYGYAGGVPGLYSGDGVRIAFKDLEIRK